MFSTKRFLIATLGGVVCGFICLGLASSAPGGLPGPVVAQILSERTLIGVAIGVSSLAMVHWALHGLAIGMVFSLPLAFSGLMAPASPHYSRLGMLLATVVLGMIYGVLIELITTVAFKARIRGAA